MGRINFKQLEINNEHWAIALAKQVVKKFPNQELYTSAAGISPSGAPHFGNFRDLMTCVCVDIALKKLGYNSRVLYSWDDYDRFRKVPKGIPENFLEYIGKPLSAIPSPDLDPNNNYAHFYEVPYETEIKNLGLDIEYKYQTQKFTQGDYAQKMLELMKKRKEIGKLIFSFMSEKSIEQKGIDLESFLKTYYPISIYSSFNGTDITEIIDYDGETKVTYRCKKTDQTETINLLENFQYKPGWKVDWAMRWQYENVNFEPGGTDHASPGGSFDTSEQICLQILDCQAPVFVAYAFIGMQGQPGKMSGSKGGAITTGDLLEIYEPALLKWLYARKVPNQRFDLAFNTEMIRQYDEFDREVKAYHEGTLDEFRKFNLEIAYHPNPVPNINPSPFRQAISLGQIVQWNVDKLMEVSEKLEQNFDRESVQTRLIKAQSFVETHNPDQLIKLLESQNTEYHSQMTIEAKALVSELVTQLEANPNLEVNELEELVYGIPKDPSLSPKENAPAQRAFFKDIYNLLLASNRGPRLSTFLWAIDRDQALQLLKF
jgi:lysyl-tRNA synthetase class 1